MWGANLYTPTTSADTKETETSAWSYLDWYPRHLLTEEHKARLPGYCPGDYLIPDHKIEPEEEEPIITLSADQSTLRQNDATELSGDVRLIYGAKQIYSDVASWEPNRQMALFTGNARFRDEGILVASESVDANIAEDHLLFLKAEYVFHKQHFRGAAERIERFEDGTLDLYDAQFTYCPPGSDDWSLNAQRIKLDQEKGFGSTYHTTLRLGSVPIIYLPYYRFPIDDKRHTGFLNPMIELGSGGINQSEIPFYINIAPNYDATLTTRFFRDRGYLFSGEMRFLEERSEGSLFYAYLDEDQSRNDESRWHLNFHQEGKFSRHWYHRVIYNEISDFDYFKDLNTNLIVNRATYLDRMGEIQYLGKDWQFLTRVQGFQTISENISDRDQPYERLPQLALNKISIEKPNQINSLARTELVNFSRNNSELSGRDRVTGSRLSLDVGANYPLSWPWAYVKPGLTIKHRQYWLNDNDDVIDNMTGETAFADEISHTLPVFTLDTGIFLERDFELGQQYTQTLEPRLFYLYTPFEDQSDTPLFDSSNLTLNYDQLFWDDRFSGGDRIGDSNQLSLGVTTRFIRDDGSERLTASAGQARYFNTQRVTLGETNRDPDSDSASVWFSNLTMRVGKAWEVKADVQWDPSNAQQEQRNFALRYNDEGKRLFNISYRTLEPSIIPSDDTEQLEQMDFSFVWPLHERWTILGRQSIDLLAEAEEDDVLESLAGLEYDSCCWRAQVLYREWLDVDSERDYGTFIQFRLKGFGGLGNNSDSLLSESIPNYLKRVFHDY